MFAMFAALANTAGDAGYKEIEQMETDRINDDNDPHPVPHLHIFVNRKKFDEGITPQMTVDAIARLVGLTAETAVVRRDVNGKPSEPLHGIVDIHQADHFLATRKAVEGGFDPNDARILAELDRLRGGGMNVELIDRPHVVIYRDVPVASARAPIAMTDVLVPVPAGYPGGMIDLAFLPAGSPLLGRVKGAVQAPLSAAGAAWIQVSYHPHNGGGGKPWNPSTHGFHTYVDEILAWLGALQ